MPSGNQSAADSTDPQLPTEKLAELGRALRARRQELGLTLQEAADPNYRHPHLSKVERGMEWPSPQLVIHLEKKLRVPAGTYLELLAMADTQRWERQRGYRRAGLVTPRSPADTYTRHFLLRPGEAPRPLVPTILQDYGRPIPPPYAIVDQAIEYRVDRKDRSARTAIFYRIEARENGVNRFRFTRSQPVGRTVAWVGLALEGAELAGVGRHGRNHFIYWLELPQALAAGQSHQLAVITEMHGLAVAPTAYVNSVDQAPHPARLSVLFPGGSPKEIWWFEDLPFDAVPGAPSPARRLTPNADQRVEKRFAGPQPRLAHGMAWNW